MLIAWSTADAAECNASQFAIVEPAARTTVPQHIVAAAGRAPSAYVHTASIARVLSTALMRSLPYPRRPRGFSRNV